MQLKYEEPLSVFGFKFNLRRYITGWHSVLMNNPWVNGEPKVVEFAMRTGPLKLEKEKGGNQPDEWGRR